MRLSFIISISLAFSIDNSSSSDTLKVNEEYIRDSINSYYKNKQEFIIVLRTGEKYRITEVTDINGDNYKFNILDNKLSKNIFYKNNISKISNYKNNFQDSKIIMDTKLEDIVFIESIKYDKQIKEIRIYSLIILGMYFMLSGFSN